MSREPCDSENPRKWRFTWEAQSHIPSLKLFLFNPHIKPLNHCKSLKVDLNLSPSHLLVRWFEEDANEVSIRVPIPRVLIDDSSLSFRAMEDHIQVKLVLLLPVDHPIISSFDSVFDFPEGLNRGESKDSDSSMPLEMDSDMKNLSSQGTVCFYCRNCSVKLTKSLRDFIEMPSINWREVADNWFGACCCSFGGISEKLVANFANAYTCPQGVCLLNTTCVIISKDDILGCQLSGEKAHDKCEPGSDLAGYNTLTEAIQVFGINDEGEGLKDQNEVINALDENLNLACFEKHEIATNENCKYFLKEINGNDLSCTFQLLNLSEEVVRASGCCDPVNGCLSDDDHEQSIHDGSAKAHVATRIVGIPLKQKDLVNGFLGNIFMARSSNLSKDIEWVELRCPQCSSPIGAYPCANEYTPLDGGVRLLKCYVSTSLPVCETQDIFRKYTLERMFSNQLVENAKDELSYRTLVRDLSSRVPMLQIVVLNPYSWCCTGFCDCIRDIGEPDLKMDLRPFMKVLFSDCRDDPESELRVEDWVTKNKAEEIFMLKHQIEELIEFLKSARNMLPPSYSFLQGMSFSALRR
ncbi:Ubiquitin-conjugating enzyme E2-binding protein [Dillenia turbinata]|uniref:Ubiquitin-conjugating enzyme E2-binding protein n=1 Tax=Dillenia turbinata TaxID=194707 RepID=A0AAN8V4R7_9MAGN